MIDIQKNDKQITIDLRGRNWPEIVGSVSELIEKVDFYNSWDL